MSCARIAACFFFLSFAGVSAVAAGETDYKDLYRRGVEYNKKGELEKAIDLYSKAIALKPGSATLFFVRGRAYLSNEQVDKAVADLSKAIVLKPDYAEAFNFRGIAYATKNQEKLAAADFKAACAKGLKDACRNAK